MNRLGVVAILAAGLTACGGRTAERKTQGGDDTAEAEAAPPPQAPPPAAEPAADLPEYVIHGVCPFACCKYGDWTLLQGGALRAGPSTDADSVAIVATGASVHTDSGVMVLQPPGLAVVVGNDTSAAAQGAGGPQVGDTVALLSYTDQKNTRVQWQGQDFERAGRAGLQILREPVQRWWVYLSDPRSGQSGWLQMNGVNAEEVGGRNCTNQPKPKS
jgi:hypothetical protein